MALTSRTTAVALKPRRDGPAWLAQEAEELDGVSERPPRRPKTTLTFLGRKVLSASIFSYTRSGWTKGQHRAAYIIGRISMAWGLIEQRLYHDIIRLQQAKNKNLYPHEAELAATFDDRVKQWRRLCASITSKLTDVDRVITKLKI